MSVHPSLGEEIQKLSPSAIIELFILDATSIGGDIFYFHAGTNELRSNIVFQGQTYTRFPIRATGFEFSGSGQFPRPKIAVSNIMSAITTILLQNDDLIGAKVTRKRTMVKFLDAVNFASGTNPTADPTAEFQEDIYFVDRKSNEDRDVVEFELASNMDLVGVKLPRRQIIQNVCPWVYRGPECNYTGAPVFDVNDNYISVDRAQSAEGKALVTSYQAYLSAEAAFQATVGPLRTASTNKDAACELQLMETRYQITGPSLVPVSGPAIYAQTDMKYCVIALRDLRNGVPKGFLVPFFNSTIVNLNVDLGSGLTYKLGALRLSQAKIRLDSTGQIDAYLRSKGYVGYALASENSYDVYEIQRWGYDTSGCSANTTIYNSALSNYNLKKALRDSALLAYQAALSALPPNDQLYSIERCGKRLSSCKARFGANSELSFGSFPASGLIR